MAVSIFMRHLNTLPYIIGNPLSKQGVVGSVLPESLFIRNVRLKTLKMLASLLRRRRAFPGGYKN